MASKTVDFYKHMSYAFITVKKNVKDANLGNGAFYRFMKVIYGLGWVFVFLIILFTFLVIKPSGSVVMGKSGFTCPNNKSYVWTKYKGFYTKEDKNLKAEDHISALNTCGLFNPEYMIDDFAEKKAKAITLGYAEEEIYRTAEFGLKEKANETLENPPYKIKWVTDDSDYRKWLWTGFWTILTFFISYLLLETVKNIILYIIFGKRFSYPLISLMMDD